MLRTLLMLPATTTLPPSRAKIVWDGTLLVLLGSVGAGLTLLLTLVVARFLAPEEYGRFMALYSFWSILAMPTTALQVVTAKHLASARGKGYLEASWRLVWIVGLVSVAPLAGVSFWVTRASGLPFGPTFALAMLAWGAGLLTAFLRGRAQAENQLTRFGLSQALEALVRFGVTVGLIAGALRTGWSLTIGTLAAVGTVLLVLPEQLFRRDARALSWREASGLFGLGLALTVAIGLQANLDALWARVSLAPDAAGVFSAGSLASRPFLLLGALLATLVLPKVASGELSETRLPSLTLGALILSGGFAGIVWALAPWGVTFLYGNEYLAAIPTARLAALGGSLFAIASLQATASMGLGHTKRVLAFVATSLSLSLLLFLVANTPEAYWGLTSVVSGTYVLWNLLGERASRLARSCLPMTLAASFSILLWAPVIFAAGVISSADFLVPQDIGALREMFWPFWNARLEFPNVETIDRLAWMLPFLLLPSSELAQTGMTLAVVALMSAGMTVAARRLGAPRGLAVLAGIIYAVNPWTANRMQHYFLLPGYAVTPLVLALSLRPLTKRTSLVLALLLSLGATTPHYVVFNFAILGITTLVQRQRLAWVRLARTLGIFVLFNLYWIVPMAAFTRLADLVPSQPTWESAQTFSRLATLPAVLRLQGYWWPLASTPEGAWIQLLGTGLAVAALLGAARNRFRLQFLLSAGVFLVLALGTQLPWLVRFLVLEGPIADKFGWLFRDPNKAVGPLAALLVLLAVTGRGKWWRRTAAASLVTYLAFTLLVAVPYLRNAYQQNDPPEAFRAANAYLAEHGGKALWVPQYFGTRTFWNGTNLTPEVLTYNSSVPTNGPYGYDDRTLTAYAAIYYGAIMGSFSADVSRLLRLWGIEWIVHHRDIRPKHQQDATAWDNLVERAPIGFKRSSLEKSWELGVASIYRAGSPVGPHIPNQVLLASSPLGATLTSTLFPTVPEGSVAFVEKPHPGIDGLALLPGDDPAELLAGGKILVDLAGSTNRYAPDLSWSRLPEEDIAWWSWAAPVGGPTAGGYSMVMTSAFNAALETKTGAPAGAYRIVLRAYRGPKQGRVVLRVGALKAELDLRQATMRHDTIDLGTTLLGPETNVEIINQYGFNVITRLELIPRANWMAAQREAESRRRVFMWPSSTLCPESRPTARESVLLANSLLLPTVLEPDLEGTFWEFSGLSMKLEGNGDGRLVEAWVDAAGTWVFVGNARLTWRGFETVEFPFNADHFKSSPAGLRTPIGRVKLIGNTSVRDLTIEATAECHLDAEVARGGGAWLLAAGEEPLTVRINNDIVTVTPEEEKRVELQAGVNHLTFDLSTTRPDALLLSTMPLPGEPTSLTTGEGLFVQARDEWRLLVLNERPLPGKRSNIDDVNLTPETANYLQQAFWLRPDTGGRVIVSNLWPAIGNVGIIASLIGLTLVLGFAFRRDHE